jgi:hypothetical protein
VNNQYDIHPKVAVVVRRLDNMACAQCRVMNRGMTAAAAHIVMHA